MSKHMNGSLKKRSIGFAIVAAFFLLMVIYAVVNQRKTDTLQWDMAKGQEIDVSFSQHPYVEPIINQLPEFEKLTGIKVNYSITPEEYYYDKLDGLFHKGTRSPDVFMVGSYYVWEFATDGYMEDLNAYVDNTDITQSDYEIDDFYDNVLDIFQWDLTVGHPVGDGGLWGIPLGFETYALAYNERIFNDYELEVPRTMDELLAVSETLQGFNGEESYGVALRGLEDWATINTSYITTYTNFGAKDFELIDGQLVSVVNSEAAIEATQYWVDLIRAGGPEDWDKYSWYKASADFGAGRAAMLFDADNAAYNQNVKGESVEAGNIVWITPPLPEACTGGSSNLWSWGLGMNSEAKNKEAAWIFIQYFTSKEQLTYAATNFKQMNPVRKSVFESSQVQEVLSHSSGYVEMMTANLENARIHFTPHPYYFEMANLWAKTLRDIVSGDYASVEEGMDALKVEIDRMIIQD